MGGVVSAGTSQDFMRGCAYELQFGVKMDIFYKFFYLEVGNSLPPLAPPLTSPLVCLHSMCLSGRNEVKILSSLALSI